MCSGSLSRKWEPGNTERKLLYTDHPWRLVACIRVVCSVEELRRCWCVQVCRGNNMYGAFDNCMVVNCAISSNKLLLIIIYYFRQEKTIGTWPLHGMFSLFMPALNIGKTRKRVSAIGWKAGLGSHGNIAKVVVQYSYIFARWPQW